MKRTYRTKKTSTETRINRNIQKYVKEASKGRGSIHAKANLFEKRTGNHKNRESKTKTKKQSGGRQCVVIQEKSAIHRGEEKARPAGKGKQQQPLGHFIDWRKAHEDQRRKLRLEKQWNHRIHLYFFSRSLAYEKWAREGRRGWRRHRRWWWRWWRDRRTQRDGQDCE